MVIVKVALFVVISVPKSRTATALSDLLLLYTKAPRAVIEELEKVTSLKSTNATVPLVVGATTVRVAPPALYPVPDISLEVVYAVVDAPKVAELV